MMVSNVAPTKCMQCGDDTWYMWEQWALRFLVWGPEHEHTGVAAHANLPFITVIWNVRRRKIKYKKFSTNFIFLFYLMLLFLKYHSFNWGTNFNNILSFISNFNKRWVEINIF